ncbi:MAG TPA: transporter substrate-binding domain-containing protein [Candidatus Saccharimonadales bacterium]|nr:transporter substrate-binding domain-containing protein [Candidatus Saccharimonadales bacterium]
MGRTVSSSRRAGIALLLPAALLAACGGSSTGGSSGTPTGTPAAGPTMQPTIAAEVPAAVKADAPLQIATDASYAPNEFVDLNGNLVGWDIDLAKDVCKVLGIACTINNVTFSDIIPSLLESPSKYQLSFSSYTPTTVREGKGIDFITYYQAGEAWLVKTGGATISKAADMCGHAVAVEAGTTEEADAWGYMGMQPGGVKITGDTDNCTSAGKQDITVDSFDTQTEANAALLSGRADFGWADQPVADYQVKLESGKLAIGGSACSVYPYGVAIVKKLGLDQAVEDAIKYLIDNNFYTQILKTWGVQDGAITSSAVGVNDNNAVGATCVPAY